MANTVLFLRWILIFPLAVFSFSTSSSIRPKEPIPITVLSGFLGSGKTTLLQNLLKNKEGLRIAVIVNDVASVNIDSKLVANQQATPGGPSGMMVELQNGCACCSLSDELMDSVTKLVTMSDLRKDEDQFQHIIIELSGVANPKQVRNNFQEAFLVGNPVMSRVRLDDTMVTLIDSSMFMTHFQSDKIATRQNTPELFYRDGEEPPDEKTMNLPAAEDEDWMKDLPPQLRKALMGGLLGPNQAQEDEENGVTDLSVSQTETSDVLVLNKIDLVNESEVNLLEGIVGVLNPRATIKRCEYGNLPLIDILAVAGGKGVVTAGAVDDHRGAVTAALDKAAVHDIKSIENVEKSAHAGHPDNEATPTSHSHSHDHDTVASQDGEDTSHHDTHSHDHGHSHVHEATVHGDSDSSDLSHSHIHTHSHDSGDCKDESHSHSHSHISYGGIGTYVYRARRPFHPKRMAAFLSKLPVVRGIPEPLDNEQEIVKFSDAACKIIKSTLRSKGFCWCADSHFKAMYWSHAGSSFDLSCLGQWWAALPRDQWPEDAADYVLTDFDNIHHSEKKMLQVLVVV